jgi:hypothetical protein
MDKVESQAVAPNDAAELLLQVLAYGAPHALEVAFPELQTICPSAVQEGEKWQERVQVDPHRAGREAPCGFRGERRQRQMEPICTVEDEHRMAVTRIRGPSFKPVCSSCHASP